jgi:hypothetical protein
MISANNISEAKQLLHERKVTSNGWLHHIVCDGWRRHVIWWDSNGSHCTEEQCEVNHPKEAKHDTANQNLYATA